MRRRRPSAPRRRVGRRRTALRGRSHVMLVTMGLALYLAILWLGIVVLEDNPVRSALFAGLIVAIAATGYIFTRPPTPPTE